MMPSGWGEYQVGGGTKLYLISQLYTNTHKYTHRKYKNTFDAIDINSVLRIVLS